MKKSIFWASIILCLFTLASCSMGKEKESVLSISIPADIVGTPDKIYVIESQNEIIHDKGTAEYNKILEDIKKRFPNALKEASMAIPWKTDDGTYDWISMGNEMNYIRLSYDNIQVVELSCFENKNHLPQKLSFSDIIFPSSEDVFIVGTEKTYGVLNKVQ